MAQNDNLVAKLANTGLYVVSGDLTQELTDAVMTAINSGGMWLGRIDEAIQRAAGNQYHAQAKAAMPLRDLQVVVAKGNKGSHSGEFRDVIFVVDDLQNPLNRVVYAGLEAAHQHGYEKIVVPTIRMGDMVGVVEKTPEEAVARMSEGINDFVLKYGGQTNLRNITFVVYRDPATVRTLQTGLSRLAISD